MRDELFNGRTWSNLKRAEYLNIFLTNLDYLNRDGLALNFVTIMDEASKSAEFLQGRTDATTNFGATMRLLRHDDPDPVTVEARQLAVSFEKMHKDPCEAFLAALYELTICQHLRNSFPKN